jgi:hypothetical protein
MTTITEKYRVCYADPAHAFKTHSDKGTGRGAVSHYDTMGLDAIKNYRIRGVPVAETRKPMLRPDMMRNNNQCSTIFSGISYDLP